MKVVRETTPRRKSGIKTSYRQLKLSIEYWSLAAVVNSGVDEVYYAGVTSQVDNLSNKVVCEALCDVLNITNIISGPKRAPGKKVNVVKDPAGGREETQIHHLSSVLESHFHSRRIILDPNFGANVFFHCLGKIVVIMKQEVMNLL